MTNHHSQGELKQGSWITVKGLVAGHSLGGALAAMFPVILAFHREIYVLGRLLTMHTYGQPCIGDENFVAFYVKKVLVTDPRMPFDAPPVVQFTHGGNGVYFDGWYTGHVLSGDVPSKNYFDPRYLVPKYGNALGDLVKGAFLWVKEGRDYREGAVSLLYRASGLVVPGIALHSLGNYVNAVRLGRVDETKKAGG